MPAPSASRSPAVNGSRTIEQEYLNSTLKLLPSVKEENPHLKQSVGNAIFMFVEKTKGSELAPKITGMLIDLTIPEIQHFLANYNEFIKKVNEAAHMLDQMQQQMTPGEAKE